jgi:hypothetical protein
MWSSGLWSEDRVKALTTPERFRHIEEMLRKEIESYAADPSRGIINK